MKKTLKGWVVRQCWFDKLEFYKNKPYKYYPDRWEAEGYSAELPDNIFPKLKFEDGPIKVKLTIETI